MVSFVVQEEAIRKPAKFSFFLTAMAWKSIAVKKKTVGWNNDYNNS